MESHKAGVACSISDEKEETVHSARKKGNVVFSSKMRSESAESPGRTTKQKRW